jgi:hypothetical protein
MHVAEWGVPATQLLTASDTKYGTGHARVSRPA